MDSLEQKSDIGNKIFYIVLILLVVGAVGVTFYKIVILKNYQIVAQVSCNPKTEKCFVTTCDPSTDDSCSKNPDEQTTYYKNISKKAATISACEATAEKIGCKDELSCITGEANCSYTYCDPNNLGEGEECSK